MKTRRTLLLGFALTLSLTVYGQSTEASRVETIQFKSSLTGKTLPYSVLLPAGYEQRRVKEKSRYPVLYLLHGLSGHYSNWFAKSKLREYAAEYQLIIVTPEGNDGWYTDSATNLADKYETYMVRELLPEVEGRFRTINARQGRSVAGLSMGGYGAIKFGLKYADKFIFAASLSGAFDAAVRSDDNPRFAWGYLRPSILQSFGAPGNPTRAANDLHQLARNLPAERIGSLPFFYFDCGTEDGFLETNRELAAIFLERKIPHEYRQLPGGHNWAYWDAQVQEILRIAARKMNITVRPLGRSSERQGSHLSTRAASR
jgi:S-formylglutathione hydrolase FrmB